MEFHKYLSPEMSKKAYELETVINEKIKEEKDKGNISESASIKTSAENFWQFVNDLFTDYHKQIEMAKKNEDS